MTKTKPPTRAEILKALTDLAGWAVGSDKENNPYSYDQVKHALVVLDKAHGGTGEWAKGLERAGGTPWTGRAT